MELGQSTPENDDPIMSRLVETTRSGRTIIMRIPFDSELYFGECDYEDKDEYAQDW